MARVYFDTEFTGLVQDAKLISIGMISEDGRTFYAESTDYQEWELGQWQRENVAPGLRFDRKQSCPVVDLDHHAMCGSLAQISCAMVEWLSQFDQVEIWSDCLAYDWVLFCNLFGGAMDIPANVYYIPFDICTLFKVRGIDPDVNREEFVSDFQVCKGNKHNALHDARVIMSCYNKLAIMARAVEG